MDLSLEGQADGEGVGGGAISKEGEVVVEAEGIGQTSSTGAYVHLPFSRGHSCNKRNFYFSADWFVYGVFSSQK